jgi:hypothetical protein
MRIDLEHALADIAESVHDDATTDRMTGQVRTMVGRIRRRRAARHTAQGAVGVGAAAAVALVGVDLDFLGGRGSQGGWGSSTGSPDAGWLQPDRQFPQCGATAPGLASGASGSRTHDLAEPTHNAYGELLVPRSAPAGSTVTVTGTSITSVVVVRDGRVVTQVVGDRAGPPTGEVSREVVLVHCSTGEPLRPGDHEVVVSTYLGPRGVEVTRLPFTVLATPETERLAETERMAEAALAEAAAEAERDRAEESAGGAADDARRAAEQLREAKAAVARHLGAAHEAFPACAARLPEAGDAPLTLELGDLGALEDVYLPAPASPEAVLRTTDGRSVLANAHVAAGLVVLREGVVVGGRVPDGADVELIDLSPTDALRLATTPSLDVCGATSSDGGGLRLPSGTYQVVATLEVMLKEVVTADGEALSVTEPLVVTSAPREITID